MPYDIIIGRDEPDKKLFGKKGLVPIGKSYVKMGQDTSLSNPVYLDVARSHVLLISGKRGSGKSYFLSVIAEGITNLEKDVKKNIAVLLIDTMGIFWSMKYPSGEGNEEILREYGLVPQGLDVNVYVPVGKYELFKKRRIPVDNKFSIKPNELTAEDWINVFGLKRNDDVGVLIERVLDKVKGDYSVDDLIKAIQKDSKSELNVKHAAENRFVSVKKWGLFSKEGTKIKDIVKGGKVSILDISAYDDWNVKCLVVSLLSKKLLRERILVRKFEEMDAIEEGQHHYLKKEDKREMPLVWIGIDECHQFLPNKGKTPATDALVSLLREGRQPGISMILATQQPGVIHKDVMTQSDIVMSLRVTAKFDIDALNSIMQTYLSQDLLGYLNNLPSLKGSAIILDDNSERIFPMRTRPKMTWHGGDTPSSVRVDKEILELGLE